MSTRPTECGYCNMDHGSGEPCPELDARTINVTVETPEGDVEVRAKIVRDRITISQCYAGTWAWAGEGTIRDGRIEGCTACFGLRDCDVTDEVYLALENKL